MLDPTGHSLHSVELDALPDTHGAASCDLCAGRDRPVPRQRPVKHMKINDTTRFLGDRGPGRRLDGTGWARGVADSGKKRARALSAPR
jgi:hypothetical protein